MKLDIDWPVKYWARLQKELYPLREDSLLVDMFCEQIAPMLFTSEEQLFLEIYEFQVKNGISPLILASARQLQKYKRGSGLSKRIHESGRGNNLANFKKRYAAFAKYLATRTGEAEE